MIDTVEKKFGRLDVAVNNAGIVSLGAIEQQTAQWDDLIHIDLRGVFLSCQAEVALMRKAKFGHIINTSSIAGKAGFPNLSHYNVSKFGVIGCTNAIAKEVAAEGITVNDLWPGIIATGMWRGENGFSKLWANPGETEGQSWGHH